MKKIIGRQTDGINFAKEEVHTTQTCAYKSIYL